MDGNTQQPPRPPLICVSDECAGTPVSLAVFDLGRQLVVWASAGGNAGGGPPALGSVALGAPPPRPGAPAPATPLVPGAGDDAASRALAARLATRLGKPVAVAWHVGSGGGGGGDDALSAWAERRLVEELRKAGHI